MKNINSIRHSIRMLNRKFIHTYKYLNERKLYNDKYYLQYRNKKTAKFSVKKKIKTFIQVKKT